MANYIVQDTSLAAVADAIRAKTGGGEALAFPAGFVEAVEGISGGGAAPFCVVSVEQRRQDPEYACVVETVANIEVYAGITAADYTE